MAEETGITVLHGKPDAAELAAVTAVLLARLRADWTVRGDGRPVATSWTVRPPRGRR
jgi:hypothetical protein